MAEVSVRFHPLAAEEAEAARSWYFQRNASLSDAFFRELEVAVQNIAEGPERWPSCHSRFRRYLLRRFPFSVVYRSKGTVIIEVLAVAHHRRKPGYWRGR